MFLDERSDCWQLGMTTDWNSNSFPTVIPTTTAPPTDGSTRTVISTGAGGGSELSAKCVLILPISKGAGGGTLQSKVYGWKQTTGEFDYNTPIPPNGWFRLWIPVLLGQYTSVASNLLIDDIDSDLGQFPPSNTPAQPRFAKNTTATFGPSSVSTFATYAADFVNFGSSVNPDIGLICVRALGFRFIEVVFRSGSNNQGMNCLWSKM